MSLDEPFDRVEEAATRIGSVLDGRWTVDSLLGIGGMAAVYAASDGKQRVAIKVLHSDLSRSQRALERFRREGEALRAALHPAVPRVHGEGTTVDDCPYLFMDLLLGETVEARRRRFGGRLPPAEVVRIALVVLDVLEVVHARGLLHRDVKPSNVLWLDDGSIRLIDFGIAAAVQKHEEDVVTRTGELPGSLAFMSPEHALGVPGELDARSDLVFGGDHVPAPLGQARPREQDRGRGARSVGESRGTVACVRGERPPADDRRRGGSGAVVRAAEALSGRCRDA